ncbi:MAG: tripartite tricarboxylate transporter TctB family protein [Rhodospirillaceae bacterium]|nr:tripartite tricarboxylate transporter TctB family protein [Rhodospirillaceae bacterium]
MRALDGAAAALIGAFGLATLFLFIPGTIEDPGMDDLSPAFMPQIVAILLTCLAALLGLRSLLRRPAAGDSVEEPALTRRHAGFILLAALWLAASFAVVALAGYLAGGAAAVVGAMLLMRIRRPLTIVATAVAAPLVLWTVFWQLLTIPLP